MKIKLSKSYLILFIGQFVMLYMAYEISEQLTTKGYIDWLDSWLSFLPVIGSAVVFYSQGLIYIITTPVVFVVEPVAKAFVLLLGQSLNIEKSILYDVGGSVVWFKDSLIFIFIKIITSLILGLILSLILSRYEKIIIKHTLFKSIRMVGLTLAVFVILLGFILLLPYNNNI